jgi:hypothetical protein
LTDVYRKSPVVANKHMVDRANIALQCVECRKKPSYEDAADWQAFLVGDPDIRELEEVVIYCPECARREFGPVYVGTGS